MAFAPQIKLNCGVAKETMLMMSCAAEGKHVNWKTTATLCYLVNA